MNFLEISLDRSRQELIIRILRCQDGYLLNC